MTAEHNRSSSANPPDREPSNSAPSSPSAASSHSAHSPASSASPTPGATPRHKGWYSRGYLPHFDSPNVIQFLTWRLADAVPPAWRVKTEEELAALADPSARDAERRKRLEAILDQGYGECCLRMDSCAQIVRDCLHKEDGLLYVLHAWVIMPNHVHVLVEFLPGCQMHEMIKSWKGSSALAINAVLGRSGQLWQDDCWDRYIRDLYHYNNTQRYIALNPVKAGLARSVNEWPWYWRRDLTAERTACM